MREAADRPRLTPDIARRFYLASGLNGLTFGLEVSALPEAISHLDSALALAEEIGLPGDSPEVVADRLTRGRTRTRRSR